MNRLIVHPKDLSTDFLKNIYQNIDATVLTNRQGPSRDLLKLFDEHEQIIMLGHGMGEGLLSVGQFGLHPYVIHDHHAFHLRKKENNIFIWCHANEFVSRNNLKGFYTGMFISEMSEATFYNIKCDENHIIESNELFATAAGTGLQLNLDAHNLCDFIKTSYAEITRSNPVAKYNCDRISAR